MSTTECSWLECQRPILAKGLCASHYYGNREKARRAAIRAEHRPCVFCGTDLAGRQAGTMYCSSKCKAAHFDQPRKSEAAARRSSRTCLVCGVSIASRSGKAVTC